MPPTRTAESDTGSITVYRYDKEFRYDMPYTPFLYRPEKDHGSVSNSDLTGFGYFIAKIMGDLLGEKYLICIRRLTWLFRDFWRIDPF